MKRIAIIAVALWSAASLAMPAHAASTVTVNNKLAGDINVAVYSGKDANCDWEAENEKTVIAANASQSFTCKGYARDRCKVAIKSTGGDAGWLCKSSYNTCAGAAMTVEDGYTLHLSADGCAYEAPSSPTPK